MSDFQNVKKKLLNLKLSLEWCNVVDVLTALIFQ